MDFDRYALVLLCRPQEHPVLDEATLDELQDQHLAHLSRMKEEGHALVSGPFQDQDDPRLRGLTLYRVEPQEARRLAELDPMVEAGWLEVQVLTWLTRPGAVSFPPTEG